MRNKYYSFTKWLAILFELLYTFRICRALEQLKDSGIYLTVPSAFNPLKKGTDDTKILLSELTFSKIHHLFSSFTYETHIDVILVGDKYINSPNTDDIASRLDNYFEKVDRIHSSPFNYVYENSIFHVTTCSSALYRQVIYAQSLLAIEQAISVDSKLRTSSWKLYLLFHPTLSVLENTNSSKFSQQSYISLDDSFAWINMYWESSSLNSILPLKHNKNVVHYPTISSIDNLSINSIIASVIQKSAEAINPYPYYSKDFKYGLNESYKITEIRFVEFFMLSICLDESGCNLSNVAHVRDIVNNIKTSAARANTQVVFTSKEIQADQYIDIEHALDKSVMTTSTSEDNLKYVKLSSRRLSKWLKGSVNYKHLLAQYASDSVDRILIPIISLYSDIQRVTIDDDNSLVTIVDFFEIEDVWDIVKIENNQFYIDETAQSLASYFRWPSRFVLHCGSLSPQITHSYKTNLLFGNEDISHNPLIEYSDLFYALREIVWGISNPNHLYSAISHDFVHDYRWWYSSLCKSITNSIQFSFREDRAIVRRVIFVRTNMIITMFHNTLLTMKTIISPELLQSWLKSGTNALKIDFSKLSKSQLYELDATTNGLHLIEDFMTYLSKGAGTFMHSDFSSTLVHLNNAESVTERLNSYLRVLKSINETITICNFKSFHDNATDRIDKEDYDTIINKSNGELSVDDDIQKEKPTQTRSYQLHLNIACILIGIGIALWTAKKPKQFYRPQSHYSQHRSGGVFDDI